MVAPIDGRRSVPSVYEGFGLVPFEAAAADVPCFFAWNTALTETLPPSTATLVAWDAAASADEVAAVLASPEGRRTLTHAVKAAGSRLRWDRTAVEVLQAYRVTVEQPPRELVTALEGTAKVWDLTTTPESMRLHGLAFHVSPTARFSPSLPARHCSASSSYCCGPSSEFGYFARHGRLPSD